VFKVVEKVCNFFLGWHQQSSGSS